MTFTVSCSACEFETEVADIDEALDVQERHREQRGEAHVLEFDRGADGD